MYNGTPIYDISKTCDDLFKKILSKPEAASVLCTEILHHRFSQWVSYLGVFAPENISLDTRLMYSESIGKIVLQFLQVASRNLDRIGKLEDDSRAKHSTGEGLQRRVAEELDCAPESGASSPLEESLRALKTAIDGLYRLGVAIRQSSPSTLNQRVSNFAQENDDMAIETMAFLRLKHKFFDRDQKETNIKSPLSLYKQLAMSISFRYFGLLYRHSREEQIGRNRETTSVQPRTEMDALYQNKGNTPPPKYFQSKNKGEPNELKKLAAANAGLKSHPEKSEGAPTTVNTTQVFQSYATTEKSFAAPKSVFSTHIKNAKYPDPPKVDPRAREARCPFCGRPISEMDLKKEGWWCNHLDQDLKLYTCLSEACADPPQLFIRFHEWSQHMNKHHSKNWIEEIHKPLGWCCDVEHDDLYFDDEDDYDRHVQETHPEYEAEKAELKEWGELQRERSMYACPICNCVPGELAMIFPWLRDGKFANPEAIGTEAAARAQAEKEEAARDKLLHHIGAHLKELGLMSVAYFGNDADSNSMGSKRGSIAVDKDGKVLLVENPPDYFDPQFDSYMAPTEPNLVENVDWSSITTLDAEGKTMEDKEDHILQHFRSHQSGRLSSTPDIDSRQVSRETISWNLTLAASKKQIEEAEAVVVGLAWDDENWPAAAGNLGHCLFQYYEQTGELRVLEAAISHTRDAVATTPVDHPDRAGHLNNLSKYLSSRYGHTGNKDDLEAAISNTRDAVAATPANHPDRTACLNNLSKYLNS